MLLSPSSHPGPIYHRAISKSGFLPVPIRASLHGSGPIAFWTLLAPSIIFCPVFLSGPAQHEAPPAGAALMKEREVRPEKITQLNQANRDKVGGKALKGPLRGRQGKNTHRWR